jgi:putative inorganic carbon (HCO3(-)) transporter
MSRMWWYTLAVLVLWVVDSELRRIYGYCFGFSKLDILAILPILSLVPFAWSLTYGGGWRRLPRLLSWAAWVWVGAFMYALVLAYLSGNAVPGLYDFVGFVLPVALGLWVAADEAPFLLAYKRLTNLLVPLTTLVSVYGVIQYVFAPAWDVAWLNNLIQRLGSTTFGLPFPLQIRVFSTLNSPVSCGCYLALMLLLVLPQLSMRRPFLLIQVPIWFIAFALSLVRTGWLMFAVGALTFLIFTRRRSNLVATLGIVAAQIAIVAAVLSVTGGDDVVTSLSNRFATLSDVQSDGSVQSRQGIYDFGPKIILAAPFGQGLGILGASTNLGSAGETTDFDSGVLARAFEMGLPGVTLYIISLAVLLFSAVQLWSRARLNRDEMLQSIAAMAIGINVSLAFAQVSLDVNGLMLIVMWTIESLAIRALAPEANRSLRLAYA